MSKLAFWACGLLIVATAFFYYPKWEQPNTEATLSYDVAGYYLYLPATLIYGDLKKMQFKDSIAQKYRPWPDFSQATPLPNGNWVMKYSSGQAFQFLPWFLAGHLAAKVSGHPTDGFSMPYQKAISWGGLFVALLGLWFLRKILLRYFSEATTATVLVLLSFGTNYLNYAAIDNGHTHNWLFTLYTLLIYSTIRFYEKPTGARAALIGLLVGWATLTRPTEIIAAILPLLWGLGAGVDWRGRLAFFKNHLGKIWLAGAVATVVASIQAIYWKYVSGQWLVYSYGEEGFNWLHPHFFGALLSGRAGWLLYSPLMFLALFGLPFLWRRERGLFPATFFFLFCFTWIVCAWNIWWYGGSLGQRAMVQSYPVWAFPMAALVEWILEKRWLRWPFCLGVGLFVYFNLWLTHQAHRGGLYVTERMNFFYLKKVAGRFDVAPDVAKFLDHNEDFPGERQAVQTLFTQDFEEDTTAICSPDMVISGKKSFCLNKNTQFTPAYNVPLPTDPNSWNWIRASASCLSRTKEWEHWRMAQFIVRFSAGGKSVKERAIRVHRILDENVTQTVYFDTKKPALPFDKLELLFWNSEGDKTLAVDNLKIEAFR